MCVLETIPPWLPALGWPGQPLLVKGAPLAVHQCYRGISRWATMFTFRVVQQSLQTFLSPVVIPGFIRLQNTFSGRKTQPSCRSCRSCDVGCGPAKRIKIEEFVLGLAPK